MQCLYGGGGITFSYAAESTSEISAEPSSVSSESENFFVRSFLLVVNLSLSFFSWFIETFGKFIGAILGLLGVGTPALFICWLCKKIGEFFLHKHFFFPFKRAVNKHAVDNFGINVFKNDTRVEYRRKLNQWEIIGITVTYGFLIDKNEYRNDHKVYTSWTYSGFTWYGVFFCDDGVRTYKGLFADETDFMSYDELRNDESITMGYLKSRFEGFPNDFFNALMQLKEL